MERQRVRKLRGALQRLLGPVEEQVSCEECFQQLDEFVEFERAGQNAAFAMPAVKAHLDGCPACAEEHASLHALLVKEDRPGGSQA